MTEFQTAIQLGFNVHIQVYHSSPAFEPEKTYNWYSKNLCHYQ